MIVATERLHEATAYLEQAKKTAEDIGKEAAQARDNMEGTFKEIQSLEAALRSKLAGIEAAAAAEIVDGDQPGMPVKKAR